jgi:hypothetical protein
MSGAANREEMQSAAICCRHGCSVMSLCSRARSNPHRETYFVEGGDATRKRGKKAKELKMTVLKNIRYMKTYKHTHTHMARIVSPP